MQNLLLVDNQALTRKGMVHIIYGLTIDITAKACRDSLQLYTLIDQHRPAILVIDPFFDGLLSIEDTAALIARYPQLNLLVVFNNSPRAELLRLQELGLNRFLSKAASKDEAIEAVQAALDNERYCCSQSAGLLTDLVESTGMQAVQSLSAREKEIVLLIAEGLSDSAIAQKLFLSFHTIRTHRKNITKKLGFSFKNAAGLVWVVNSLNNLI